MLFLLDLAAPPRLEPGGVADPLSTVGLALLAYGLVQLLGKIVDKLAFGRGSERRPVDAFGDEDRRRLERVADVIATESTRLERMQEALATQQRLVGQALDELRAVRTLLAALSRRMRFGFARADRRENVQTGKSTLTETDTV